MFKQEEQTRTYGERCHCK